MGTMVSAETGRKDTLFPSELVTVVWAQLSDLWVLDPSHLLGVTKVPPSPPITCPVGFCPI